MRTDGDFRNMDATVNFTSSASLEMVELIIREWVLGETGEDDPDGRVAATEAN